MPTLKLIKLSSINVDHAMQSREKMCDQHVARMAASILSGNTFKDAPIDVFKIKGERLYRLVDGFHRDKGHRLAGKDSIWAMVHEGTVAEAVMFAASANAIHTALRFTNKDKRKAVVMMLENPELFGMSDKFLGSKCDLHGGAVGKIRELFCMERGITQPAVRLSKDGRVRRAKRRKGGAMGKGFCVNLLRAKLLESGVLLKTSRPDSSIYRGKNRVFEMPGAVARPEPYLGRNTIAAAIGDALLSRQSVGAKHRALVIGYASKDIQDAVDLARGLGVEVMTPEEAIADFSARKEYLIAAKPAEASRRRVKPAV